MSETIRRRWLDLAVVAIIMACMAGLAAISEPLFAESGDSYPGIDLEPGSLWRLTDKSPDNELMWFYSDNGTKTGQFEHLVKNEQSSKVRYTKIKAYFDTKPTAVNVSVFRRGVCHFSSTDTNAHVRLTVGGQLVYNQPAFAERKYGNDARDLEKQVIRSSFPANPGPNDGTTNTWTDPDPSWPTSRICGDLPADTYQYIERQYKCTERDKDNKCTKREYVVEVDTIKTRLNDVTGKEFRGAMPTAINPVSTKAPGSRLWEVEIQVQLTGGSYDSTTEGERLNQVRYDLKVPGAKYVGFAETPNNDSGERQFGVAADINDTSDKWGIKIAVPFGMACSETAETRQADLALYDVDMQSFGRVYGLVFERNQETGEIRRLNKNNDYFALDRFAPASSWDRLVSVNAYNRETSRFSITMKRGFSYMLVINNPNQVGEWVDGKQIGLSPLGNVVSVRVPTDSLPGIVNCNYTLTPSVDGIPPTFSYDADFTVTGRIGVEGEDFQDHLWQLCAIKFTSMPDISSATNTNTPDQQQPGCETLASGNQAEGFGSNFATGPHDYSITDAALGETVCFMMSVQKPTFKTNTNVWAHSQLQCSQSGVSPKLQAWGYDTKATGRIKTSITNVGGQRFGSWGEYGVLSNLANTGMASGNGLLGGVGAGTPQSSWSSLTFANDSTTVGFCGFGCYGGVTMPIVSTQGAVQRADLTVSSYGELVAIAGSSKGKIRINGLLRISGDLIYPNSTAGIAGIPKIQLIANDIIVDNGVGQVDPWLIAVGTDGTNGRISTCTEAQQSGNYFVPMQFANLYGGPSGICTNSIKFNAPLIAGRVFLYRTYDERNGARAAETLNVRADNFLSSYVGGGPTQPVAVTESVRELPPRF